MVENENISLDIIQQALLNSGLSSNPNIGKLLGTPGANVETNTIELTDGSQTNTVMPASELLSGGATVEGIADDGSTAIISTGNLNTTHKPEAVTTETTQAKVKADNRDISIRGTLMVQDSATGKLNRHIIRKVTRCNISFHILFSCRQIVIYLKL